MHRYYLEHQLRRQVTKQQLTLMDESVERTGLDTLVVHAVNDANSFLVFRNQRLSESDKLATWGVRSQE